MYRHVRIYIWNMHIYMERYIFTPVCHVTATCVFQKIQFHLRTNSSWLVTFAYRHVSIAIFMFILCKCNSVTSPHIYICTHVNISMQFVNSCKHIHLHGLSSQLHRKKPPSIHHVNIIHVKSYDIHLLCAPMPGSCRDPRTWISNIHHLDPPSGSHHGGGCQWRDWGPPKWMDLLLRMINHRAW